MLTETLQTHLIQNDNNAHRNHAHQLAVENCRVVNHVVIGMSNPRLQ